MHVKNTSQPPEAPEKPAGRYITLRLDVLSSLFKELGELSHQRNFGLSVREVRLLLQIHHNLGLSMSRLVELTYLEKTLVSRAVTRLTRIGLVERQIGSTDARQVNLVLTRKGEKIARQAAANVVSGTEEMMGLLPARDREVFERVLDVLTSRAEQQLAREHQEAGTPLPATRRRAAAPTPLPAGRAGRPSSPNPVL
ncbi:MAG: MarR family winged helix-turn-helix transcriptional regulator [Ramlibacter sp.]|nr:MarR family winged helix-turn-helix transcriptional regulator [Ramlibacter sp.]